MEHKTPPIPSSSPPPRPGPPYTTPPGPGPHFITPPTQFLTPPPGPGPQAPHGPGPQWTTPPGPGPQFMTPGPGPSQFSTPPGPPVFSSPFGTGQAGQRSLYSGGFSNGSQELPVSQPVNQPISLEDVGFESPFVLFSAHKLLKKKKQANIPSLGFGAIVSPGREILPCPEIIERDPHRCQNCGAYSNLYCEIFIQSGEWNCIICNCKNSSEGHYMTNSKQDLSLYPELATSAVDYILHTNNRHVSSRFVPADVARSGGPVFVLIDESLDEAHLAHLQGSLHAFVDSLNPTQRVGFITYGRTVSVFDFSEGSVVLSDVVSGDKSPSEESLKPLVYGLGVYLSPMHASLPVAHNIISGLRAYRDNVPEALRDRCLGTAVEVALGLIQGPTAEISRGIIKRSGGNCRILVCTGGPCTFGPGSVPGSTAHPNYTYLEKQSVKHMHKLGFRARRYGTIIDVLCAGTCPVRVPVLQPLAKSSGGVLILHDDFGEAFGVNLQRAAARSNGSNGSFEIRCSAELLVTQVIGPGEEAQPDSNEGFKNDNGFMIEMDSVEETQSFTICMENKRDVKKEFVYFQFSIKFSNSYQSEITRVITLSVPTTDSLSSYLSSIQSDILSVIISKRTILNAKTNKDCANMRHSIDERTKEIAYKLGTQIPNSKSYKFPREIASIPELLFHLRRGPLLGGIISHEDERAVLRELFLKGDFELSFKMVGPTCLMYKSEGVFEEVPSYDLVMQSDKAVVLDHGTDIFIWLGAELAGQESKSAAALAACRTLAEEISEKRFPAPRILSFKEGSSQARYFVSRLIPAHKDPTYEQEARFPQLQSLNTEQRSKLKSSFVHFDDFSFCEWMRSLKLVPPEPS